MKTDLDLLIEHLELERTNLQAELDRCLVDLDYEYAHYFLEVLRRVSNQLEPLTELDPTNKLKIKDEKAHLKSLKDRKFIPDSRRLSFYSDPEKREAQQRKSFERVMESVIREKEEEIRALESIPTRMYIDGEVIDDVLDQLINNKIGGFKLYLKQRKESYLALRMTSLGIVNIRFYKEKYRLDRYEIDIKTTIELKSMGFQKVEASYLELDYNFTKPIEIKELLSRIIFDACHFNNLDKDTIIEIED